MNAENPDNLPVRHQIRLPDYDYRNPGAYFITICTHERQSLFGKIVSGQMVLNPYGEIAAACWKELPSHYQGITNETFIVMPNHVHGIIVIEDGNRRAGLRPAPTITHSLFEMVRAFKAFSSRRINELRNSRGNPVWQRGYYEHVIRGENEFSEIGEYITFNPAKWETDCENPDAKAVRSMERGSFEYETK